VQIHRVLSDITGVSGLAIVDAILAGERDGRRLAALRDGRVKASEESIVAALEGDYRAEHLFTLKQSLESYRHYQKLIGECDRRLREDLDKLGGKSDEEQQPPAPRKNMRTAGHEDLRQKFYRILGVDLTAIPGVNVGTLEVLLAEVGPDLSRFRSASAFARWLALCPDNTITGGKVISSKTRRSNNRLAGALRMAAESLSREKSHLGHFYRRMKMQLNSAPQAITAAAHKLARIIYTLVTKRLEYDESHFVDIEKRHEHRQRQRLIKQAGKLGYVLVSASSPSTPVVS
jgi:transposase